jgi:hypothetical protein
MSSRARRDAPRGPDVGEILNQDRASAAQDLEAGAPEENLIDCMKRGIPMPDSAAARTMEPPSALRGSAAGKHARCINLDEVCILDPAMSRKILMAFRTRDYGDVLRVFSHSCKFKTVKRILMPLNISWEGISLGTGSHWIFA